MALDLRLYRSAAGVPVLQPEILMGFHGLCVVKAVDDDDWYMGTLNSGGTVECWSAYDDLWNALRGPCLLPQRARWAAQSRVNTRPINHQPCSVPNWQGHSG